MSKSLAIVQCGQAKVWKKEPKMGKVPASEAYTSTYFKKNVAYARRFCDNWVILSAKYGFLRPDHPINDYNVTFKRKKDNPISIDELATQVNELGLDRYGRIVVLGGKDYYNAVVGSYSGSTCEVLEPFVGMQIGKRMSAINQSLEAGREWHHLKGR